MMPDPKQRFTDRVENYIRYRPSYPAEVIELLRSECGLTPKSVVADIGSGTGILSQLFLHNGNQVYGVEPNAEMCAAGERLLAEYKSFSSIPGSAEQIRLPAASVDFVVAGQAFHWFDRPRARAEFGRILKPGGWVVLLWNNRLTDTTPFLRAYEDLLMRCGTDYALVDHKNITGEVLQEFFHPRGFKLKAFPNRQVFDFDGLRGRALSSSYIPAEGHPSHAPFMQELKAIFEAYNSSGAVTFEYETQVYYGQLS
jgi:SAM-dependent methyltransferase